MPGSTPPPRPSKPPKIPRRREKLAQPHLSSKKHTQPTTIKQHVALIASLLAGLLLLLLLLIMSAAVGGFMAFRGGGTPHSHSYQPGSIGSRASSDAGSVSAEDAEDTAPGESSPDIDDGERPEVDDGEQPDFDEEQDRRSQEPSDDAIAESNGDGSSGKREYRIPGGEFFGFSDDGNSFVYVVDCSASMFGAALERAKKEILRSIRLLTVRQSFFIVFFDDREHPMYSPHVETSLAPASDENVRTATQWVTSFQEGGGTEPEAALRLALKLSPDVIYFLTDGHFDPAIVHVVRNANRSKVRINTISFIDRSGESLLRQIATENGGQFLFVP